MTTAAAKVLLSVFFIRVELHVRLNDDIVGVRSVVKIGGKDKSKAYKHINNKRKLYNGAGKNDQRTDHSQHGSHKTEEFTFDLALFVQLDNRHIKDDVKQIQQYVCGGVSEFILQ